MLSQRLNSWKIGGFGIGITIALILFAYTIPFIHIVSSSLIASILIVVGQELRHIKYRQEDAH